MLSKFAAALAIFAASASGSTTEAEGRILVINGNYKQPKTSSYRRSSKQGKSYSPKSWKGHKHGSTQQQGSPISYAAAQQYHGYRTSQPQPRSYTPQHAHQQPSQVRGNGGYQPASASYPQHVYQQPSQYQPHQPTPTPAAGSFGAHTLTRFKALEDAVEALQAVNTLQEDAIGALQAANNLLAADQEASEDAVGALQAANNLLIADSEFQKKVTIIESAYEVFTSPFTVFLLSVPAGGGVLELAEWCADGPGVVKVRAGVTIRALQPPQDGNYPQMSLIVDGALAVYAQAFDQNGEDTLGFEWAGAITDSTTLQIQVSNGLDQIIVILEQTAWVSYELYPSHYPFTNELPGACSSLGGVVPR